MSAPVVTSLKPAKGPTGGLTLVTVEGTGFRVPAASGAPTVGVLVGGRPALDIRVWSPGLLTFVTPAADVGPADVVVRNVDDAGQPIPGEEAVLRSAFAYELPSLTPESDLTRLVRTMLQELKRQVLPNVSLTVQTDFDSETGAQLSVTELASLPGLVLVGPELSQDRFYSLNELPAQDTSAVGFARRRVPYTVDLTFTLVGVSDHTTELLNLMAAAQLYFHRNKYFEMDRDPSSPIPGRVRHEMDIAQGGDLKVTSQPNESNVRSFSGSFVVRGFDLEDLAGFPGESAVESGAKVTEVALDTHQAGNPRPVGNSSP